MMNDDLDEMVKARHEAFVAGLTAVQPPARLPSALRDRVTRSRWAALRWAIGTRVAQAASMVPTAVSRVVAAVWAPAVVAAVVAFAFGVPFPDDARPMADLARVELSEPAPRSAPPESDLARVVTPRRTAPPPAAAKPTVRPAPTSAAAAALPPSSGVPELRSPTTDLSIRFAPDSAELQLHDLLVLRAFARAVESGDRVSIAGHTARLGSVEGAIELSQRRADVVRSELVGAGVPAASMTVAAVGYDEASNEFDPRDRRVVLKRFRVAS